MQEKSVLVIYYTQTGQIRKIIDSVVTPLILNGVKVDFEAIRPVPEFPFPWGSDPFFQAFPESFMGIPCKIDDLTILQDKNYDLIILGYSPWYLSPSIPVHSFLQSQQAKELMNGKAVITLIGCRNMWLMSQEKIKKYMASLGSRLVGNIVLCDKAANLVSVVTIIRWLVKGKQEKSGMFPAAGVSPDDIKNASRFGELILGALKISKFDDLQENLNEIGAIDINPNFILFERNGSKIFKMWSSKILKKGPYADPRRRGILRWFKYYLLTVLFIISPIGSGVYFFIKPFINRKIKREVQYFSQNSLCDNN
jgi:hypothetical protein